MDRCANTEAINNHLKKMQDGETNYEMFCDFIDDDLVEIKELIDKAMKKAKNYNNTDFSDELKDLIIDLI